VVFAPEVLAADLAEPARALGGVLVYERQPASATRILPGQAARVASADQRVQIDLPATAADRALTIRYQRLDAIASERAARGLVVPQGGFFGQADLDAFALTATDDVGQDQPTFRAPVTITMRFTAEQLLARGLRAGDLTLAGCGCSPPLEGYAEGGGWSPTANGCTIPSGCAGHPSTGGE
jgi:hypothetical protein